MDPVSCLVDTAAMDPVGGGPPEPPPPLWRKIKAMWANTHKTDVHDLMNGRIRHQTHVLWGCTTFGTEWHQAPTFIKSIRSAVAWTTPGLKKSDQTTMTNFGQPILANVHNI